MNVPDTMARMTVRRFVKFVLANKNICPVVIAGRLTRCRLLMLMGARCGNKQDKNKKRERTTNGKP